MIHPCKLYHKIEKTLVVIFYFAFNAAFGFISFPAWVYSDCLTIVDGMLRMQAFHPNKHCGFSHQCSPLNDSDTMNGIEIELNSSKDTSISCKQNVLDHHHPMFWNISDTTPNITHLFPPQRILTYSLQC